MTETQEQRTFPQFKELDIWAKALDLWEVVLHQVTLIPAEDEYMASKLKVGVVELPMLLARAHQVKYWDRARRQAHLKLALEKIAEIDVLFNLAIELEYIEPIEEFEDLLSDLSRMTAGMLKSRGRRHQRPDVSSSETDSE